jgi:hypothetical protein
VRADTFRDYDSWALHVTLSVLGDAVIASQREWIVPLEPETPAY